MDETTALVAIVDDQESIRKALVRVFRAADFRVEAFESAVTFLESLPRKRPDCVILDLHMPGMTGIELLERLSELDDPPAVIVVTADDAERSRDECMALGTKRYLRKPVDSLTLIDSVRDAVGRTPTEP